MVFTRSQIENLSREELIEELVKLSDITDRLKELTDKFEKRRTQGRFGCYQKMKLSATFSYLPIKKERCE